MLSSRLKLYQEERDSESLMNGVRHVCRITNLILDYFEQDEWIRERLKIVRYEDLAMNPVERAKVSFIYQL